MTTNETWFFNSGGATWTEQTNQAPVCPRYYLGCTCGPWIVTIDGMCPRCGRPVAKSEPWPPKEKE